MCHRKFKYICVYWYLIHSELNEHSCTSIIFYQLSNKVCASVLWEKCKVFKRSNELTLSCKTGEIVTKAQVILNKVYGNECL